MRILLLVILAVVCAGCMSAASRSARGSKQAEPPSPTHVSWSTAVRLMRSCRAKAVGQTHARYVTLTLRDGRELSTVEPQVDDIYDVLNPVTSKCPPMTVATE